MSPVNSEGLRRQILAYAGIALAAVSLLVSVAIIAPLSQHLRDSAMLSLGHSLELKAQATDEYLTRTRTLARLITNRSVTNDRLAAYLRGEGSLPALSKLIQEKLEDALSLSPELAGITCFDTRGNVITAVGRAVSWANDEPPLAGIDDILILPPRTINGMPYLVVAAPIRSRDGARIGTDVMLVDARPLVAIVRDTRNLGATGDVALLEDGEHPRAFLSFGGGMAHGVDVAPGSNEMAMVVSAHNVGHAISRQGGQYSWLAVPVPSVGWTLLLRIQSHEAMAIVDRLVLWGGLGAVVLVVAGVYGMMLMVRPLIGTCLVPEVDVRRQVQELGRIKDELSHKTHQLAISSTELQEYAYAASHDLQEPLRTVTSFSQLLARRYHGQLGLEADEFIGFIIEGADRLGRQINDLLAYANLGGDEIPAERIDLEAVMGEILDSTRAAIAQSGAMVTRTPLPVIRGYPDQITRLFQNLVANALKFIEPGEVPRIDITSTSHDGWLEVVVRDEGIGIESQYQDRIFHMFKRLHPRGSYEGSGVGLAMCRKIAENHDGRIWVVSHLGEGAAFHVLLPLAEA